MRYRWDPAYPATGRWMGQRADADLRASDVERNEVADKLAAREAPSIRELALKASKILGFDQG